MSADAFNSLGGYSVGIPPVPVIDANGNVVTNVLVTAGNVSAANVYAANYYYANGRPFNAGGNPYGPNNSLQYNNNGTFDGSANLIFDDTTQLLSVPSINISGLSNLGPVGNVTITGGGSGYLLTTDGNGILNWQPPGSGSAISNGQSNISINEYSGNITAGVNGVANVVVITSNSLSVNGNVTATNFLGNATTAGTVTTNAQPNITSVGTLTAVTVTGNVVAGGVKTNNLLYANGAPWDLQEPAGGNQQVQFNNGNNNFGASINFTFNTSTNILTVPNIAANGSRLTSITGANVTGAVPFANVANNVAGANVSGAVPYANVANNVAGANVSGEVSFAAVANSIALANVVGIGNIASIYLDGNVANILHGDGTWSGESGNLNANYANYAGEAFSVSGSNVIGEVANANYASYAGEAFSVSGSNVVGEVANANYASYAGEAFSVSGANVVGEVANANYASYAGEAFSVSGANVIGAVANANYAESSNTSGTVTSNAQPNITSVGTLISLDVTGNVTANNFIGTFANGNSNVSIPIVNGNIEINANGNKTLVVTGSNLIVKGDLLPEANITYNLGSSTQRWKDLYISGNTIDLNGSTITSDANGITLANPLGGTFTVVGQGASNTASIVSGNSSIIVDENSNVNISVAGISNVVVVYTDGLLVNGNANITANLTSGNANLGNLATANYVNIANVLTGNIANFSGNITSLNADLGNLATANYVNIANVLTGNIANFIGNLTSLNADLGNLAIANYVNIANVLTGNIANFSGNLTSLNANLGNLATANYVNIANVLTGNIANFSGNITSLNANLGNLAIANYIRTDELFNGNSNVRISPNGNVTVSVTGTSNVHTLSNAGANVVGYVSANGNGTFGALYSNSLTSQGSNLTLYAATGNNYIELRPSGLGQVDVGNFRIQNLGTPNSASDAATKQYVDDVAQGLNIHDSCQAATPNTLAIITTGVVTYNNGASGVGANLTTTGSFNLIDGVNVQTSGTRILVKNEANAAHNGIYVWSNATVITRAGDFNSVPEVEAGDFTFVTGGTEYDNTGWVQVSTVTTIGTDPIDFVQFSGAGTYQAGLGLTLTGTVFSVNVDNTTTEIAGGNVVVKANAQLTTPNIGAATGTSINLTGNVLANNVTSNNKITTVDIDVSGNVIASNISANSNLIVNNATVNLQLTGNTANFSSNVLIDTWLTVSNTANVGNLRTDNLLHANGTPWDLELPGGGNTQLQFNDNGSFGGSANLAFNKDTSNLSVNGNVVLATGLYYGDGGGLSNIAAGNVIGLNLSKIANGNSNVSIPVANGNVQFNVVGNLVANITGTGANINGTLNVSGLVTIPNTAGGATAIEMGSPTQGNLVSNAVTLTTSSSVSNAIAQLNVVLGKLVPPAPPNFPAGQSITVASLSTYRMANYVQTDNTPGANKSVAGGTTVTTVRRASSYSVNTITTAGPGDTGTISVQLNGANAGSRTLTANLNGNGTYSNLIITNNYDYNTANANIPAGFWSVFTSQASGTVTEGWNEVYIADSATSNTNTYSWFYDSSNPGTPAFSTLTISPPGSPSYTYSSTVPHYNNTNIFTLTANVNKLSGNMYPTSDNFVTGTAGGAFGTPSSVTYTAAGVTTPLAQNLYVSSGNASISTTSTIIAGFGASSTGPSLSSNNSYNSNTQAFTSTLAANVLYKTGTTSSASVIEEANVFVGSTIGSGSGLAFRIINPGSTDTPVYTGSEAAFNSQSSTLQTYDPTVVANILKHDQTNYSTGYLPAGPNLSSGRSGSQYFTIKIIRTSVSKFDVKWTGNIAGLWVALPGSTIDSTSSANGWIDMSVAYAGAGIPGVNSPGNGSNGCALGGVAPLNSAQTNKSVTATFGTVSSSSTATNEIYIRIKLTSGQSVTALSLQTASN